MAEQDVHPRERQEIGAEPKTYPERSKRTMRLHARCLIRCDFRVKLASASPKGQPDAITLRHMRKASSSKPKLTQAARALRRANGGGPLLLAVSGGLDSMTLLDVAARDRDIRERCTVATFDHSTGPHARRAARLVRATARALGMHVVVGRARETVRSEAAWRAMRWQFLRSVAKRHGATIVTAHTRDDQLETVVMRLLRGTAARGLAALYAHDDVARPFLGTSRRTLERYARARRLTHCEDPTNTDLRFLRNRVRRELLPALRAASPSLDRNMLTLARRAAALRRETERVADRLTMRPAHHGELRITVNDLAGIDRDGLALLWPAVVAKLGVALDRRGVNRASDFALGAQVGKRMQCSGGITLERTRGAFLLRRDSTDGDTVDLGRWNLREVSAAEFATHIRRIGSTWGTMLNRGAAYSVRPWNPGDRVRAHGHSGARRVARFFSEQAIPVSERSSWPVVTVNDEVQWVPGVWKPASTVQQTGNDFTFLVCERRGD